MNVKLKSDRSFIEFLRSGSQSAKLGVILLIGASLILIGSFGRSEEKTLNNEEDRIAEMCSLAEGVGRCEVMLSYSGGEVVSALVLCEGADSAAVRARVVSMVSSLYGIGTHRIEVVKISK